MILQGIEYQHPTSLNMRILADHVTYSFLAFMKSIFHFCLGCYCGGYSQNGRSNLPSFNYDKCKVLKPARVIKNDHNYVMNNILLENMSNFNDLGINISNDLDWQLHIHLKVNKANSMLLFIKRTYGYSLMSDVKHMLYLTLIRFGLLYESTVWYPNKACKKLLEGVQCRATEYILNDFESSYKQRLHEVKLVP